MARLVTVFTKLPRLEVGHGSSLVRLRKPFSAPKIAAFRGWPREEPCVLAVPA
jgi:hypothetical protein